MQKIKSQVNGDFRIPDQVLHDNKKHYSLHATNGFGILEIVIVSGLIAMTFAVFLQTETVALRLIRINRENLEAMLLAGEALDATRAIRDESWTNNIVPLADGTLYYPIFQNSKWTLTTTAPPLVNGVYVRYVLVGDVMRDAQDKIVSLAGVVDPGTKKVTARVLWGDGRVAEVVSYLTNFQASLSAKTESKIVSYEDAATESNLTQFPSGDGSGDPAQSFTTLAAAIAVSRVDIQLRRDPAGAPSDVYAEIRTSPTGAILGTSNQVSGASIIASASSWVEFRFQNPVSLSAATTYYIRLRTVPNSTDNGSGGSGLLYWRYEQSGVSGPYAGGQARRFVGRLSNPSDTGEILTPYDFGFKVYAVN